MIVIFFFVSLLSSITGALCGIGGGVITKPVLDAFGLLSVSSISFLSGCTVLAMSVVSVMRYWKNGEKSIEVQTGTPLAIGASIGGIFGKVIFQSLCMYFVNENAVGAVQAILMIIITVVTLFFFGKERQFRAWRVDNTAGCLGIGLLLGLISSFLGIGGGPLNLLVLQLFFSMDRKQSAANSLYIILFSQLASLLSALVGGDVPEVPMEVLMVMVTGGLMGGYIGSLMKKRMALQMMNRFFCMVMLLIIGINILNFLKFV